MRRSLARLSAIALLAALAPRAGAQAYSAPEQISPVWDRDVLDSKLTSNGERIVFIARTPGTLANRYKYQVFVAPTDATSTGARPVSLTPEWVDDGFVTGFEITPDDSRVVYVATYKPGPNTIGVYELFSAPLAESDGAQTPTRLNPPLVGSEQVNSWQLSADGEWVVFDIARAYHIYAARTDGRTPPILLADLDVYQGRIAVSPACDRIAYIYRGSFSGDPQLYVAPIDGSTPPVVVNGPLPPPVGFTRPGVGLFEFSPDGESIFYTADEEQLGRRDLMVVPADGSGPSVRFSHRVTNGYVRRFFISPTGAHVTYELIQGFQSQLWTRATDGTPAHRTSEVRASIGNVGFTPNGERIVWEERDPVLFVARHLMSNRAELGFTRALRLDTFVEAHEQYQIHFTFSADSLTVAHTAFAGPFYAPIPSVLKTVPVDGSAFPFVARIGPGSYAISPDGERLLYTAVKDTPNQDLYSIPIDGSRPATRVTNLQHAGGIVRSLSFASGGADVVFRAQQRNATYQTYRASYTPDARVQPRRTWARASSLPATR